MTNNTNPGVTTDLIPQREQSSQTANLFPIAISLGVGLRLIAVIWGDIGVYVDGATKIAMAMRWAEHPVWQGLSGVWPPVHIYFLGTLIRFWNQPVLLAKLVGFVFSIATLFVVKKAVRPQFGPAVAAATALLLAVYWTHIWLTSSYWVEVPYLFFVLLAVVYAERVRTTKLWSYALVSGLSLSLAMLLRNEGLLLLMLFAAWYLLQVRTPRVFLVFITIPVLLMAWYFIEPALHGGSYFDYFAYVARSKEFENLVENISRRDALTQWILMLGATPTVFVVLPGLYGLWEHRRRALTDLFAWMFVAQVIFYFSLTLTSAWRPQLRYLMLQFINLLPYAAMVWLKIMRRFGPRVVIAMLVLMIFMQGLGFWLGRNNRLPGGWLPLQVITLPQQRLDALISQIAQLEGAPLKVVSVVPGPRAERWALEHSFVVNRLTTVNSSLQELDVHVQPEILGGVLPTQLESADVLVIDPQAVFYPAVMASITRDKPERTVNQIHPHLDVILLSDRSRRELGELVSTSKQ